MPPLEPAVPTPPVVGTLNQTVWHLLHVTALVGLLAWVEDDA